MDEIKSVSNIHLDAVEHGDSIVFMHSVKSGAASQSYGLQVARLAGVPIDVIKSAKKKLRMLERQSSNAHEQFLEASTGQLELFNSNPHPIVEQIREIEVDDLTAKQALDLIYELIEKAKDH